MGGGLGATSLGNFSMNYRQRCTFYFLILVIVFSMPIVSQTIERSLDQSKFEIGIDHRFYKRDFTDDYTQIKWYNDNLVLR